MPGPRFTVYIPYIFMRVRHFQDWSSSFQQLAYSGSFTQLSSQLLLSFDTSIKSALQINASNLATGIYLSQPERRGEYCPDSMYYPA